MYVASAGLGSGTKTDSGSRTDIGDGSHTWADWAGSGPMVGSDFRSLVGFGTGSRFMAACGGGD